MTRADLLREGTEVAEDAFPDQLARGHGNYRWTTSSSRASSTTA